MSDTQAMDVPNSQEVEKFLTSIGDQAIEDPAAVSSAIIANILQARSAEELFNRPETTDASSLLGVRIVVSGVRWMRSDFVDGLGFYCLIDAANDDGEKLTISCGSRNVMAQLYRAIELHLLPCYCAIVESERTTAAGYKVMSLEGRTAPA